MTYPSFPKIERLSNLYCVITEKIDGTNGLIEIDRDTVRFGSKNRYLDIHNDNAGFCNFYESYKDNFYKFADELINMSDSEENQEHMFNYPIRIYGEWFGKGIQRNYGLEDKFFMPFSLFYAEQLIKCEVPNIAKPEILYKGKYSEMEAERYMDKLANYGSYVVNNWMKPEGIVINFPKYKFYLKSTFDGPKWKETSNDN